MSEESFYRNYLQLFNAIDNCLSEQLILPALILIYSGIDSASWLASNDEKQSVSVRFQSWASNWMLSKYPLPCNAEELYIARCGILHTLTPSSNKKKGVRLIAYAWGNANHEDLSESIKLEKYPNLVALQIEELSGSFKSGLMDFLNSLENDAGKKEMFLKKASQHFAHMKVDLVDEVLLSAKKTEDSTE